MIKITAVQDDPPRSGPHATIGRGPKVFSDSLRLHIVKGECTPETPDMSSDFRGFILGPKKDKLWTAAAQSVIHQGDQRWLASNGDPQESHSPECEGRTINDGGAAAAAKGAFGWSVARKGGFRPLLRLALIV